ncbi:hypothetical protein [Rhodanobacter sp. DHB23]|uniref:hypothetical protein n=1 Tax=Rhodanobacter sp. DHB23 TaxID=2775923 RepID=UPI0017872135|nr:hypothetical protein [Rhodanobacter sp. DHB23]MBD8872603.1 hypothetical protein [Rhodanobacter sp. DHB23]
MLKLTLVGLAGLGLAACTLPPIDRSVQRLHAERNCRVHATVAPAYAIDSTGIGLRNVAFDACMRTANFAKERQGRSE